LLGFVNLIQHLLIPLGPFLKQFLVDGLVEGAFQTGVRAESEKKVAKNFCL
jgi:hypothetical protein